jgi:hypothetical protein
LLFLMVLPFVRGEMKSFRGPLPATSSYVQFSTGYLIAPGYIDLSQIRLTASADSPSIYAQTNTLLGNQDDDNLYVADDDATDVNNTDENEEDDDDEDGKAGGELGTDNANDNVAYEDDGSLVDIDDDVDVNENDSQDKNEGEGSIPSENEVNSADANADNEAPKQGSGDNVMDSAEDEDSKNTDDDASEDANSVEEPDSVEDAEESDSIETDDDASEDTNSEEEPDSAEEPESIDTDDDASEDTNSAEEPESIDNDEEPSEDADPSEEDDADMNDSVDTDDDASEDASPSEDTDDASPSEDTDDGNRQKRELIFSDTESVIDLIFFLEPVDCIRLEDGTCDWARLGVGSSDSNGNTRWCCSEEAMEENLCEESQLGRLILDEDVFSGMNKGEHRPVSVPGTGDWDGSVQIPHMDTINGQSGKYTLVLANCNDYGRNVLIDGKYIWKSKGGFLPGDLFSEFHFFTFLTIAYVGLLFWYAKSMTANKDSVIGIQKWILGTIVLAAIELFFRTTDYMVWNLDGVRPDFAMYSWITFRVLKGAISRCLLVMVSLGWGVIRDTLGDVMKKIILLGVVYSALSFGKEVAAIIFVEEFQILSNEVEKEIYDIFAIFTYLVAACDVTFIIWIFDGMNSTMEYLENMNQSMKLKRFLRLRLILILSVFFVVVAAVFTIVDATMDTTLLSEGQEWLTRGAFELNYILVLLSIALLWKPDPRAKEFAYVMELPSIADDENDLALDTSIGSPDEEDGVNVSYSDYQDDGKFTIGNATST